MGNLRLISFCFLLLFSGLGLSQSPVFIKSYGNAGYDYGRDIKQTLDTGYIATGSSSSFDDYDSEMFLLKVDTYGDFQWSYNYGGTGSDWGESVILTNDSAYAIAGYTNSFGAGGFDFYLVKTDINGIPEWENTYGGDDWDKAYAMVQLPDSGYVLVGETYSFGEGNLDMYIVRVDKFGDLLWSTTYGGTEHDYANDVILHGDSIVVVGTTYSEGAGDADGILLKYHIDGALGSKLVAGMEGEDFFKSINRADNYYIMGGSRSYHHFEDCDCGLDFWIYKIDTLGLEVIADTTWDGTQPGDDVANDIVVNSLNDIFYAGTTTSWGSPDISEGVTDAFLNKLLLTYATAADYVRNFGDVGDDDINALDFCYDKGIVGIGSSPFYAPGGRNIMIIRNDEINSVGEYSMYDMVYDDVTLDIKEESKKLEVNVFPTLIQNYLTITGLEEDFITEIYDLNGKLIYHQKTSLNKHDLSRLDSGYYILKVESQNEKFITKIVKD